MNEPSRYLRIGFAGILITGALIVGFLYYVSRPEKVGGDFTLQSGAGEWSLSGNPKPLSLLYIGYAKCPDVCPTTLSYVAQAYKELSEDEKANVQVLFLSVDAEHESASDVANYAKQFHSSFIGLTGTREQIDRTVNLFNASYIVELDPKSYLGYSIAHTDRVFLLDNEGTVMSTVPSPRSSDVLTNAIKEHL